MPRTVSHEIEIAIVKNRVLTTSGLVSIIGVFRVRRAVTVRVSVVILSDVISLLTLVGVRSEVIIVCCGVRVSLAGVLICGSGLVDMADVTVLGKRATHVDSSTTAWQRYPLLMVSSSSVSNVV